MMTAHDSTDHDPVAGDGIDDQHPTPAPAPTPAEEAPGELSGDVPRGQVADGPLGPDCSPRIGELVAALAKAQLAMQPALKDTENKHLGTQYASLASVLVAARPALAAQGIALIQTPSYDGSTQTVTVVTVLCRGEQWIRSALTLRVPNMMTQKGGSFPPGPQQVGISVTYARRYALMALVGLAPEDDDGEVPVAPSRPETSPPPAPPAPSTTSSSSAGSGPDAELEELQKLLAAAKTLDDVRAVEPRCALLPPAGQNAIRPAYVAARDRVQGAR